MGVGCEWQATGPRDPGAWVSWARASHRGRGEEVERGGVPGGWGAEGGRRRVGTGALSSSPLARAAPPPPPPRGALRVPNRAVGACEARRARSVRRLVQAAAGGLRRALTAAFSSDAAAAAAGASLPPPPGRRRGADPQRHLGRCTLLRRPGPLPPSSPFPCTSPFPHHSRVRTPPPPPGSHFTTPDLFSVTPQSPPAPVSSASRCYTTPLFCDPELSSKPYLPSRAPHDYSAPVPWSTWLLRWACVVGPLLIQLGYPSLARFPHFNHRTL